MAILKTQNLTIGYISRGKSLVIQSELNLNFHQGELVCLIGPNGSGKSTLLRTLGGLQKSLGGQITFNGRDAAKLTKSEKARLISLVLTDKVDIENAIVRQIVAIGRHPYSNWWGTLSASDNKMIDEALEMVHLEHKQNNLLSELSDGERQRAMIAKALVQDTPVIFLDEPTAHLDLPNRVEIMLLLHKLVHSTGKSVLLSTHELDLALQAADRIWLMTVDKGVECGVPEDLVFNGNFKKAFRSKSYVFNEANGNFSLNYPMMKKVGVKGDKTRMYWTLRALARKGVEVVEDAGEVIEITGSEWIYKNKKYTCIESLLNQL